MLDEVADFQSLSVGVDSGPCPTSEPCGESFLFKKDGSLIHTHRARRFEGRLSASDLAQLSLLATSSTVVEQLTRVPGCPGVIHGTENTEIEIAPGIFIGGDVSGCGDGPLAALRYTVHEIAKRLFPESGTQPGPPAPLPSGLVPYRLKASVEMKEFTLRRTWGLCAPPMVCGESLSVSVASGRVSQLGGSPRGEFRDVTDFEPLRTTAVRPSVIAELRKPSGCPPITDVSETMSLAIGHGIYLRASTAGCSDGPIGELRAAARALVARLAATPAPDAGPADHPPD
jgi:hypothetical protein